MAEADNTNRGLNNPSYLRDPNLITVLSFICKYFFQDRRSFSLNKLFSILLLSAKPT